MNDGVLVIDNNSVVRIINEEYTRITGVTKNDIIEKSLNEVRPGAVSPTILNSKKGKSGVYRKEGEKEYVVDMAPIVIDNKILGVVNVLKSLTEVHYLAEELKSNKRKLNQLENTMGNLYRAQYNFSQIIGEDKTFKDIVFLSKKIAHSNMNVLILGESGTGKELFAQSIHNESSRFNGPFVPINCAAIPSSLIESELFGYEEGSFTGSKKGGKIGLFELANGGTLFLDEIGDMPMELQVKLLRTLEEGYVRKIGGLKGRKVDVRVVAASNKELTQMVEKEQFREDLYYRLNESELIIPSLRKRKEDLFILIEKILKNGNYSTHFTFNEEAKFLMLTYQWPGNIRELKNAVRYAINICKNNVITAEHLPETIKNQQANKEKSSTISLQEYMQKKEKEFLIQILSYYEKKVEGKKRASQHLGVSLATLYNKINQFQLDF